MAGRAAALVERRAKRKLDAPDDLEAAMVANRFQLVSRDPHIPRYDVPHIVA